MQPGLGKRIAPGRRRVDHHRLGERRRIDDAEQFVDVDRLGRQAAADDVVARPHQFDAGAVQVGVEVAGGQVDRLAGLQHDVVEEQRGDHARVAGVPLVRVAAPRPLPADRSSSTPATVGAGSMRPRYSPSSTPPGPVAARSSASAVGADVVEQASVASTGRTPHNASNSVRAQSSSGFALASG